MNDTAGRVTAERWFGDWFGGRPEQVWLAPGRANLIGEHTDYNQGWVLPFALDLGVTVAAARRGDGLLAIRSRQAPGAPASLPLAALVPGAVTGWAAYPAGVAWALREAGHPLAGGASLAVDSDLPQGAGLSSSAALECAAALALDGLHGLDLPRPQLATLAQHAENDFVGVPSGIMDQSASLLSRAGHALLLDCRTGVTADVPLDPAAAGLALLIVDTGARHALGDGRYAQRRRECEQAAALLGVGSLRDVTSPAEAGGSATRCCAAGPAMWSPRTGGWNRRSPCSPAATWPGWGRCCARRTPPSGTTSRSPGPRPTWRWTPPWPRARWGPG